MPTTAPTTSTPSTIISRAAHHVKEADMAILRRRLSESEERTHPAAPWQDASPRVLRRRGFARYPVVDASLMGLDVLVDGLFVRRLAGVEHDGLQLLERQVHAG